MLKRHAPKSTTRELLDASKGGVLGDRAPAPNGQPSGGVDPRPNPVDPATTADEVTWMRAVAWAGGPPETREGPMTGHQALVHVLGMKR